MSTNDTRIQTDCGQGHRVQAAPSSPPRVLESSDPDTIPLRRKRDTRVWQGIVVVMLVMVVLMLLFEAGLVFRWQGSIDLRITFVVTDADTGAPIPGAAVHVVSADDSGYRNIVPFTFTGDAQGAARHWYRGIRCGGSSYPAMPWRDTWGATTPSWCYYAVASNYCDGELQQGMSESPKLVRSGNGSYATVTVPLTLRKLPPP
jgi:hypothetical protein